jgi:hypothetical protein
MKQQQQQHIRSCCSSSSVLVRKPESMATGPASRPKLLCTIN